MTANCVDPVDRGAPVALVGVLPLVSKFRGERQLDQTRALPRRHKVLLRHGFRDDLAKPNVPVPATVREDLVADVETPRVPLILLTAPGA